MEKHRHVLVVDDEPTICSLMNVFLTQKGYLVQTANCGEDALVLFQEAFPDIVLLDISMPRMPGMLMSISTTWGRCLPASSMAS